MFFKDISFMLNTRESLVLLTDSLPIRFSCKALVHHLNLSMTVVTIVALVLAK